MQETLTDYTDTEKTLELDRTAISPGDRLRIVDDWVETAGQMTAAVSLVERADGIVNGISVVGVNDTETQQICDLATAYSLHSIKPR